MNETAVVHTVKETMGILKISRYVFDKLVSSGELKVKRTSKGVNSKILVPSDSIRKYLIT